MVKQDDKVVRQDDRQDDRTVMWLSQTGPRRGSCLRQDDKVVRQDDKVVRQDDKVVRQDDKVVRQDDTRDDRTTGRMTGRRSWFDRMVWGARHPDEVGPATCHPAAGRISVVFRICPANVRTMAGILPAAG